jgi:hypothetical protein
MPSGRGLNRIWEARSDYDKMNLVVMLVMLLLVFYGISSGMVWVALGICLLMAVIAMGEKKPSRTPFFYPPERLKPVSEGMQEQMVRIKYQSDWTGHEDDHEMHNAIGEKLGPGLGRGLGLLQ